jgi:signal transduction histidine kinase
MMDHSAFLIPIITLLTAQITVLNLARFRFPLKKMIIILGIQLIVQTLVSGSILLFLGYDVYVRWFVFVVDLPAFLVFLYTSKRRDMRDVFTTLMTIFISILISIPAIWISQLLNGGYRWYNLVRIILFIVVFFMLHFFVRKQYLQLQDVLEKGWGIFSIQPAIGLIFMYFQFYQFGINENSTPMLLNCAIISLLILVVFWILYYVFKQLHEKYLIQEQQRILTIQSKAQLDKFEQQKEMAEMTNRRWHDLRHSTQELIELLEAGELETAMSYLKEQRGMAYVPKADFCLHPAVNSILCLWAERSHKAGIDIKLHMDVPEKLDIDPMELSALFANAFENAYEGCLRLPEGTEKFIKAEARYNGKQLAVGFSNSCADDIPFENGIPVSAKSGGGIGTRSMAYTVQRFRGNISFSVKDAVFAARFVLKV